ncbi:MAG: c-type cytochrome [Phaeovulum sp.]|uniref:c-type cytochrome n=1 Tax=Phaeovulum sp. TaxID=2934796 RepID=UPI002734F593|nr:c-type cytochrome [Phaeovulum sp.]MDP3861791.1 c-type cytochrome [Phaeovulum sp.]
MLARPLLLALATLPLAACLPAPVPTGAADYAAFCAACHGPTGKGDGLRAYGLGKPLPDLTSIAARNGGSFPRAKVMTQIWGYARATPTPGMPTFSTLLEGRTVLYDSGDGILTPTPLRLVQLAEFVEGM